MANTLWVTEYSELGQDSGGSVIPAPREPALRTQMIDFTSGSANVTLKGLTRYVRLRADTACHVVFGTSAPTATTSDEPLEANLPECRSVYDGVTHVAAVGAA